MTMCVIVFPSSKWQKLKLNFLKRTLILAQTRNASPQGATSLGDTSVKEFTVYKSYLLFFGLIDGLYKKMFKVCFNNPIFLIIYCWNSTKN